MKSFLPVTIVFVSLTLLSGCDRPERESDRADSSERQGRWDYRDEALKDREDEQRDAPTLTQERAVDHFDAIELRGGAELIIKVGPAASVNLDASERTLKYVETRVRGDKLIVDVSKKYSWFSNQGHLKITITTPVLKSLKSNGAGDIEITGLNGGDQELELSGAHNVKAVGRLDKLKLKLSGAGNVNYKDVIVADARVTVNGAGNVELHATDSLRAEVNGVGAVTYSGDPSKVESELHGLGSIGRSDKSSQDDADDKRNDAAKEEEQAAEEQPRESPSPINPPAPPRP